MLAGSTSGGRRNRTYAWGAYPYVICKYGESSLPLPLQADGCPAGFRAVVLAGRYATAERQEMQKGKRGIERRHPEVAVATPAVPFREQIRRRTNMDAKRGSGNISGAYSSRSLACSWGQQLTRRAKALRLRVASVPRKGRGEGIQTRRGCLGRRLVGASMTEGRKGPLHNSGWDCTGESIISEGKVYQSDGFCLVTDPDGDTINLVWERTNNPGGPAEAKTKGTYLSGTGKYTGHTRATTRLRAS